MFRIVLGDVDPTKGLSSHCSAGVVEPDFNATIATSNEEFRHDQLSFSMVANRPATCSLTQ